MQVQVVRAVYIGGILRNVGEILDVADVDARESIINGKVIALGQVVARPGPMTTKTAAGIVEGATPEPTPEPTAQEVKAPKKGGRKNVRK